MTSIAKRAALLSGVWRRLGWPPEVPSTVLAPPAAVLNIGTATGQNRFVLETSPASGGMGTVTLAQLAAGYSDATFSTAADGSSAVFRVNANGGRDSTSAYPRTELREVTAAGAPATFDALASGTTRTLEGRVKIAHVPPTDPDVIFAQLHDGTAGRVTLRTMATSTGAVFIGVVFGNQMAAAQRLPFVEGRWYAWRITVTAGKVDVYLDNSTTPLAAGLQLTQPAAPGGWYWRAGASAMFNDTDAGVTGLAVPATEYAEVWLTALAVGSAATAPVEPPALPEPDWEDYGVTYPPDVAGVRPGVTLVDYPTPNVSITQSGTVLSGYRIAGTVTVSNGATGVIIRDCHVRGSNVTSGNVNVIETGAAGDVLIEHCEIQTTTGWGGANGIGTKNYTSRWNKIHHVVDGLRINRSGSAADRTPYLVISQGDHIFDQILDTPDPMNASREDKKTHSDGIQIEGGNGILIEGVCIDGYRTTDGTSSCIRTTNASPWVAVTDGSGILHPQSLSAIIMTPNQGWTITNLTIRDSWLRGGEITVNGLSKATGSLTDCKFDRGALSGTALWQKSASTMTLARNTYEDTGTAA